MPSSRESSQPREQTYVSCISCIAGAFFTHWATWEAISMHIHANICDSLKVYSFSEVKHTSQNTEIINEQFNEFLQWTYPCQYHLDQKKKLLHSRRFSYLLPVIFYQGDLLFWHLPTYIFCLFLNFIYMESYTIYSYVCLFLLLFNTNIPDIHPCWSIQQYFI